ncbi:hypothetical protein PAHAL_3G309400 [Panicum hallii]|uniref:Uncharacterized protein n=1 Tax=Panicum hallii TaxID=206008 RepID=A0A2S3HCQ6_9POAL|nr:hypothetical protein PAHAL_3G309400 [Panicum hallii]
MRSHHTSPSASTTITMRWRDGACRPPAVQRTYGIIHTSILTPQQERHRPLPRIWDHQHDLPFVTSKDA